MQHHEIGTSRRSFLKYVGAGVTAAAAAAGGGAGGHLLGPLARAEAIGGPAAGAAAPPGGAFGLEGSAASWKPVAYPIPLPGDPWGPAEDAARLAAYEVKDALLLPEGFTYDVLARWGDRFGAPGHEVTFGYAADYTGLVPVEGKDDEFFLLVNHEYISAKPWLQGYEAVMGRALVPYPDDVADRTRGRVAGVPLDGPYDLLDPELPKRVGRAFVAGAKAICRAAMEDLGLSILRVRRLGDGRFEVVKGATDHRRVSGISRQNVTEAEPIRATGPAAAVVRSAPGTFSNCSGETTPWGTFLTCEENVQDQVMEFVTPEGEPLPGTVKAFFGKEWEARTALPFEFEGLGQGIEPPLDGRHFGWVVEVDPKTGVITKHTALGRFRHENVALRVEAGKRLVAYLGDDRRGGHVWKFVSDDLVADPKDPANSRLLARGTLHVARFEPDFTGRWIPLVPEAKVVRPRPEACATGFLWLPRRPLGGHVSVGARPPKLVEGKPEWEMTVEQWVASIEAYAGRRLGEVTLGHLVRGDARGVIATDAYAMASAVGGTPCSRPEDVEVHPADRSVYVVFSDSTGSADGSPDRRIFPDSAGKNSRQYGAIYRLVEADDDPAATSFAWGKFVSSGEAADGGGGFACADNLVFDPAANLWMVCDITTQLHNGAVDRGRAPAGAKAFVGVFGNNAMFVIPTAGEGAGVPRCFAIGPMECELTGPTFTRDGTALILAVQHPGELNGTRGTGANPEQEVREMALAARDGRVFVQRRTVPMGSNFPSGKLGEPPRPCVVVIRRA